MKLPSSVWIDAYGHLHWSIPTFLAELGLPVTEENTALAIKEIATIIRAASALTAVILEPQ
jgi:hypothetical protein